MAHREKLERAQSHFQAIENVIEAFIATEPHELVSEYHFDRGEIIVHARKRGAIPRELPLIVGDALYNMRSALDHLAFSLAVSHVGRDAIKRTRNFPIHVDAGSYRDKGVAAVAQMCEAARAAIAAFQPFENRMDGAKGDALGILNNLCNIDKHRQLVLVDSVAVATQARIDMGKSNGIVALVEGSNVRFGPFEDQAAIIRIFFTVIGPDPKVHVKTDELFEIAFPENGPAAGEPIIPVLEKIYRRIRDDIFPALEPFL